MTSGFSATIQHRGLTWDVECEVTQPAYASTRDMPGEGAYFRLVSARLAGEDRDVLARLSPRYVDTLEAHPELQAHADDCDTSDNFLGDCC